MLNFLSLGNKHTRRIVSALGGTTAGLLTMFVFVASMALITINQVRQAANVNISEGEILFLDIRIALEALNSNAEEGTCSNQLLHRMRVTQFQVPSIRDIGFFVDDNLVCTTGLGGLFKSVEQGPFTYESADRLKFSLNVPIEMLRHLENHHVVRIGDFNAVIRKDIFSGSQLHSYELATYLWEEEAPYPFVFSGSEFPKTFEPRTASVKIVDGRFSYHECSSGIPFCVLYHAPIQEVVWAQRHVLIVVTMISLFVGILATLLIRARVKRYYSLSKRVCRMIDHEHVVVHFQPLVSLIDGEVVGAEVLCRLREDNGDILYPDKFLPEIQRQGLTWELTKIVVSKAVSELSIELSNDIRFELAINIFPRDFERDKLLRLVRRLNIPDNISIALEITECEALENEGMADVIKSLQAEGIQVSIDDFGTGYSNFGNLNALGVDCLKIDKSFIQHMAYDSVHSSVVPHMIRMAKSLNLQIVAEGVETAKQAELLRDMNVDIAQGYLFNRPVSSANFGNWLRSFDFMQSLFKSDHADADSGSDSPLKQWKIRSV